MGCKSITAIILVALIAIGAGYIFKLYQNTQLYYPDQTWSLVDTIPVWSANHPHSMITAGPDNIISLDFGQPIVAQEIKEKFEQSPILKKAGYQVLSVEDVAKDVRKDVPDINPETSMMSALAGLQPWDRRSYFIAWWNYAIYDKDTDYTGLVVYLYHHYPEHIQRPPETHAAIAVMNGEGLLVSAGTFIVPSKDVLYERDTNIFYNHTTLHQTTLDEYKQRNANPATDMPFYFQHIMDPHTTQIKMTGHFPTHYSCDWFHPDRVADEQDAHAGLLNRVNSYFTFDNMKDTQNIKNSSPLGLHNNGTFSSEEPIDIQAWIKDYTDEQFAKLQQKAEKSTTAEQFVRQNYTCASMVTFNYTLYPVDQGYGNHDYSPKTHENELSYREFVDAYVETWDKQNVTAQEIVNQRKITDPAELYKNCKNGVSYLHAYNSVADGFLSISPMRPGQDPQKPNLKYKFTVNNNFPQLDATAQQIRMPRDYVDEQYCGDLNDADCVDNTQSATQRDETYHNFITQTFATQNQDSGLAQLQWAKDLVPKYKNYRYAAFSKMTITTMTPNSITFWSHAPQHRVPALYNYLNSTGQLSTLATRYNIAEPQRNIEDREVAQILWNIASHVNRQRWYGGSSFGCCLTRGEPSNRFPWAWILATHNFNKNDALYVYGIPVILDPTGEYRLDIKEFERAIIAENASHNLKALDDQQIAMLIKLINQEAAHLSIKRDYHDLIVEIIKTFKNAQNRPQQRPTTIELKALPPAITQKHQHPAKTPNAPKTLGDASWTFGDVRIRSPTDGDIYAGYTYTSVPQKPQLSTRFVYVKDTMSYHPPHPWIFDNATDVAPKNKIKTIYGKHDEDYKQTAFTTDHYTTSLTTTSTSIDKQLQQQQQPIAKPMTFHQLYHDYYNRMGNDYITRFKTNAENLPIIRASSDGHLSFFNVTNYGYTLYLDHLGSAYAPLHRVFTQETRSVWTQIHATGRLPDGNSWHRDGRGFGFRASVPMWTDVGDAKVAEIKAEQYATLDKMVQFHKDIQDPKYTALLTPKIKAVLLTDEELTEYKASIDGVDGALTLYTALRTVGANVTVIEYNKHYIRGDCNSWYQSVGSLLIHKNRQSIAEPTSLSRIQMPTECPLPGDLKYTVWCGEYSNYPMQSNMPVDPLDITYNPNQEYKDSCVVYTKHLYIPQADMSLNEHAYEMHVNLDINYMMRNFGAFNVAAARQRQFDLVLKEAEKFYQQQQH